MKLNHKIHLFIIFCNSCCICSGKGLGERQMSFLINSMNLSSNPFKREKSTSGIVQLGRLPSGYSLKASERSTFCTQFLHL